MPRSTLSAVAGIGERAELRGVVGEADDLERVVRPEPAQGALDGALGVRDRLAAHAARAVEDEDHLHRRARQRRRSSGGCSISVK